MNRVVQGIAGLILLLLLSPSASPLTIQQKKAMAREQYDRAELMRQALNGRAHGERTRQDYERVIDAYRRVYYTTPAATKADASIVATAELQAEMGRLFHDNKALKDSIANFRFLCRDYPGSKYRLSALFTIAQIYREDLNDTAAAKAGFEEFLQQHPQSRLSDQARKELAELNAAAANPSPAPAAAVKQAAGTEKQAVAAEKKRAGLSVVSGIRFWSTPDYTRVAIDVDEEVKYEAARLPHPDRIFFDLYDSRLASTLIGKSFDVGDGFLRTIRTAPFQKNVVRIVLDVQDVSDYSVFLLPNPYRLIIDVHGRHPATQVASTTTPESKAPAARPKKTKAVPPPAEAAPEKEVESAKAEAPKPESPKPAEKKEPPVTESAAKVPTAAEASVPVVADTPAEPTKPKTSANSGFRSAKELQTAEARPTPTPNLGAWENRRPGTAQRAAEKATEPEVKTSEQMRREAAEFEKKYKEAQSQGRPLPDPDDTTVALHTTAKPTSKPSYESVAPRTESAAVPASSKAGRKSRVPEPDVADIHVAAPNAHGETSLIRALGLKIGKIVVDAGHGGHDTGTVGPGGLMEKDLVLDVSMRLGKLLESRMGAEVVYTRDDDTFIPLETRTATANQVQADLFVSVHANSSPDATARGVETYYLNFTSEPSALQVAARENAVSQKSIHELQDLVKKITLKEKIEESRELAGDVQTSLAAGLTSKGRVMRNRGVKKAPFIVLIGANMPSVLAEISFLSNPGDEKKLRTSEYRQQVAESLYKGISKYVSSLSGFKVAQVTRTTGQ